MKVDPKDQILARIDAYIESHSTSDRAISLKSGGGADLIRNWRNKPVLPRIDSLIDVARVMGVAPEWLAFGIESANQKRIPLVSWVSAGKLIAQDGIVHTNDYFDFTDLPDGDWIALRVKGDSMDKVSPDGSIILVNRAARQLVNKAYYVIQDQDGQATYKRYRSAPHRFEPVSNNDTHQTYFPEHDPQPLVFGRVFRTVYEL